MAPDFIYLGSQDIDYKLPGTLKKIFNYNFWLNLGSSKESYPLLNKSVYLDLTDKDFNKFLVLNTNDISDDILTSLVTDSNVVIILNCTEELSYRKARDIGEGLISRNIKCPVVIKKNYKSLSEEEFLVYPATDAGGLLIDGFGDGIWLESDVVSKKVVNSISFGILQASRTRISKTEYISCPSCGRTLFDLQETTAKVREKTNHLKGLKIGIMGCIVNGPGEMADADYGYVGSGVGKITLYRGKEVVKRSIDSEVAVDELINLIKENNDWVEPE
jgi:(E)-4-hydroxy-3-methylbut-2-enyl-diphosphate synthase